MSWAWLFAFLTVAGLFSIAGELSLIRKLLEKERKQ